MRKNLKAPIALLAAVAALGIAGCGGDDDETTSSSTSTTSSSTGATGTSGATGAEGDNSADAGLAGDPKERTQEIEVCLDDAGHTVIKNPGGTGNAEFQLVVDAGSGGIVYIYPDEQKAADSVKTVTDYEKGAGRTIEQLGDTVIAYMKEAEKADLTKCISG
jgi:hypothetical protein